MVTNYWKCVQSLIPSRDRECCIHRCIGTVSGHHPPPSHLILITLTDDKAVDAGTDRSLLYNSYVMNMWICAVSTPYIFNYVVVKYMI
jgi:hypothetical protein